MNTYIPTIKDIYMVSYITIRGWELIDDHWEKDGYNRELSFDEKESNSYHIRNKLPSYYFGKDFTLDAAYLIAVSDDEKKF